MAKRTASDFLILGREDAATPQPEVNNSQRVSSALGALLAFPRCAPAGRARSGTSHDLDDKC